MSFNLQNYFLSEKPGRPEKSLKSKSSLIKTIKSADPDIIMISEIGGKKALKDFQSHLQEYPFSVVMHGGDPSRYIGCIAKFKPEKVVKVDNLTYKLKPKNAAVGTLDNIPVQRGFLHTIFRKGKYQLHIVNAHLKARLFNRRYNQTDMRRMEARLLKYYINDIIKDNPQANILVTGDLNDVYSSNPLITLRGESQKKANKKLYDLKPADAQGTTWTHWWKVEDTYGRIDYLLASSALLPEIDFKKTRIAHIPKEWLYASDHRPIMTVIQTQDKKAWNEDQIQEKFQSGIYIRE